MNETSPTRPLPENGLRARLREFIAEKRLQAIEHNALALHEHHRRYEDGNLLTVTAQGQGRRIQVERIKGRNATYMEVVLTHNDIYGSYGTQALIMATMKRYRDEELTGVMEVYSNSSSASDNTLNPADILDNLRYARKIQLAEVAGSVTIGATTDAHSNNLS